MYTCVVTWLVMLVVPFCWVPDLAAQASRMTDRSEEAAAVLLFKASRNGDLELVRDLIVAGVNVNAADPDGWTGLMHAADAGQAQSVRTLLDAGANPNVQSHAGIAPLFMAAIGDKPSTANILTALASAGADPNARTEAGLTPLLGAITRGHDANAVRMIELGADVNAGDGNSITPLLATLARARPNAASALPLLKRLLQLGANPNATADKGLTPLMLAVNLGDLEAVTTLLGHGADATIETAVGATALDIARSEKKEKIAALLARHVAPDTASVAASPLPLMAAIVRKDEAAVREQVRLGADVNAADPKSGWSALMFAAQAGSLPILEGILAADAKVNNANREGITALHVAALAGHTRVVERLLKAGADLSAKTAVGITPAVILLLPGETSDFRFTRHPGVSIHKDPVEGSPVVATANNQLIVRMVGQYQGLGWAKIEYKHGLFGNLPLKALGDPIATAEAWSGTSEELKKPLPYQLEEYFYYRGLIDEAGASSGRYQAIAGLYLPGRSRQACLDGLDSLLANVHVDAFDKVGVVAATWRLLRKLGTVFSARGDNLIMVGLHSRRINVLQSTNKTKQVRIGSGIGDVSMALFKYADQQKGIWLGFKGDQLVKEYENDSERVTLHRCDIASRASKYVRMRSELARWHLGMQEGFVEEVPGGPKH
jgi:uncharacterized protein